MIEQTSASNPLFNEIQELVLAAQSDDLSLDQAERLESLVCGNATARRLYARYVLETASLRDWAASETAECEEQVLGREQDGLDFSVQSAQPVVVPTASRTMPGASLNNWLFSYFAASVILCVALLGGWAYKITHYDNHLVSRQNQSGIEKPQPEYVGRITGMADCEWADPDSRPYSGSYVLLGRKYELTSGLLEITYDTGAKVILEGPCQFTADSTSGGHLAKGKLTARVEKKEASGQWLATSAKPQTTNPQPRNSSLILHPSSLFTVTTPTVVVTDLGTEFGVEVKPDGITEIHVFEGEVEAEWSGQGIAARKKVRLIRDEAVAFDGQRSLIEHLPVQPRRFYRSIARPSGKLVDVAAKKTIVKWSGVYRYGDPTKHTSDWTTLERFGVSHVNDGVTDETNAGESYWLGRAWTPDEYFIIFLRGRFTIERIELMNTHSGPGNDHGTKDFEIWAADEVDSESELVAPRLVLKGTLPCRFGAGPKIPFDVFTAAKGDFTPFHACYIKFVAKTYYEGAEMGGCGLNEIKVFATSSTTMKTQSTSATVNKANKEP